MLQPLLEIWVPRYFVDDIGECYALGKRSEFAGELEGLYSPKVSRVATAEL